MAASRKALEQARGSRHARGVVRVAHKGHVTSRNRLEQALVGHEARLTRERIVANVSTARATQRELVLREGGCQHERAPGPQGGREAPDEVGRTVAGQHPGRLERKVSAEGAPELTALRVGVGRRLRKRLAGDAQGRRGHAKGVHVGREVKRCGAKALLVLRHGAAVRRERHRRTPGSRGNKLGRGLSGSRSNELAPTLPGVRSTEPARRARLARTHVPELPGDHLGAAERAGGAKRLEHARIGRAYD